MYYGHDTWAEGPESDYELAYNDYYDPYAARIINPWFDIDPRYEHDFRYRRHYRPHHHHQRRNRRYHHPWRRVW